MTEKKEMVEPRDEGKWNLFIYGAIAIGIFFVLDQLDAAIATPLREISSIVAHFLLNLLSMPVTLTGTILATENFTFDVVPACSGSTTLRVLLTVCVVWCGIHPRLTLMRKLICILLAVPIALVANGLRITLLVGLGDILMKPVEGFPHIMIGVLAFVLAMATVFLLTESLSTEVEKREVTDSTKGMVLGLFLLLLYIPVWVWFYVYWSDFPGQRWGIAFVVLGLAPLIVLWLRHPRNVPNGFFPLLLFIGAMFLLAVGLHVDLKPLLGASLILSLSSFILLVKGFRFAFVAVPLILTALLGFPLVGPFFRGIAPGIFGGGAFSSGFELRVLSAALLMAITWLALRKGTLLQSSESGRSIHLPLNLMIFAAALALLFQSFFNSRAASFDRKYELDLSYLVGDWVGTNSFISDLAIDVIGRDRIVKRRYIKGAQYVDVIITNTGADRRRAHRPEACMTGSGYKASSRIIQTINVGGEEVPASRFIFSKPEIEQEFFYWFSDGEIEMSTYDQMFQEDLKRRLGGIRTDWFLYRVTAPKENNGLKDFLASFQPEIVESEKSL